MSSSSSSTLQVIPQTRYRARPRSQSFNHTVIRRQPSESLLTPPRRRKASFEASRPITNNISTPPEQVSNAFLSVGEPVNCGASSIDESASDDEDSIHQSNKSMHSISIPTMNLDNNREGLEKPKTKLKTKRSMFGLLGRSHQQQQQQQLYDDGTNSIYPPPQKQSGQRDQYGFLTNSQWITNDAFNEFESYYAPITKRRLLKWRQLLAENNNQWPAKSSKVKRFVRKGIPPELRGQAWFHYSGAKSKMEANRDVYINLVQRAEEMGNKNENMDIIERDLHRTFPENDKFRPSETVADKMQIPIIASLRRLLLAFSIYSPNIGYCQSLNYIAGMLLLFMSEEEAFWTFAVMINQILPPNVYDVTMEGANIDQNVLMILISERYPHLWNRISGGKSFWECEEEGSGMPTCSLVTSHWFLTLFINILPVESVLRVWDCLFYDGQKVLFRVALAIFKLNENEILSVNDPLEVFQIIQNMPKRMVDCHKLIDATYLQFASTTRVSEEEIIDRRELFRKRRDERRRNIPVQKFGKLKSGSVRGTIIHRAKEARYYVERAKTVKR